jgi:tyrosyl-tRNA synthetase
MVSASLFGNTARDCLYICSKCALKASKVASKTSRRWIGTKYLAKVAQAEREWQEQALQIRAGKMKSMLTILEERGLVHQITGYNTLGIGMKLYID